MFPSSDAGVFVLTVYLLAYTKIVDTTQAQSALTYGHRDLGRPPDFSRHVMDHTTRPDPAQLNGSATSDTGVDVGGVDVDANSSNGPDNGSHSRPKIRIFTMDARCRMFEFVISFVLLGVTCLFGFVGNVLSILTLRRDSIKSVTTFLLSALAVSDTVFLIPVLFVILIPTACEFYQNCPEALSNVIPMFEQFGWGITGTCHTCTVYITVLVAFHRYLWVCRIHAVQRLSGIRRAKIQVATVPLFALFYNSPRFFEYKVVHYSWNDTMSTNTIRKETTKILATVGRNHVFQIGYKNVVFIIFMYLVPLAILIFVSVQLIRTLKTRRDTLRRIGSTNSSASTSRRDDNITLVLIIIIAAFIVCQTPIMVQRLILAISGTSGALGCGTFYFYFEHIAYYMVLLNSSTNFVIYILFSPHFRQTLVSEVLSRRRTAGAVSVQLTGNRIQKSGADDRESVALIQTAPGSKPALMLAGSAHGPDVNGTTNVAGLRIDAANGIDNSMMLTLPETSDVHCCLQTTNHEQMVLVDEDISTRPAQADVRLEANSPKNRNQGTEDDMGITDDRSR